MGFRRGDNFFMCEKMSLLSNEVLIGTHTKHGDDTSRGDIGPNYGAAECTSILSRVMERMELVLAQETLAAAVRERKETVKETSYF
jgi:hypothetical protein